jgi:hypothetical protein
VSQVLSAFDQKAEALEGAGGRGFRGGFGPRGGGGQDTLAGINRSLSMLMGLLQGADAAPTPQAVSAVADSLKALEDLMARWNELKTRDLANLNAQLKEAGLPAVEVKD